MSGQIEVILGPMFSGKSTELVRRLRRHLAARKECVCIKFAQDLRYSVSKMSTHDRTEIEAISTEKLSDVAEKVSHFHVIGIDEGQFFPDIVDFCESQANNGRIVIVAALDGTFQRKSFGSVLNLIPLAESVTKLSAVCHYCAADAAFSLRIGREREIQLIGGADKYHATCRTCYLKNSQINTTKPLTEYFTSSANASPKKQKEKKELDVDEKPEKE